MKILYKNELAMILFLLFLFISGCQFISVEQQVPVSDHTSLLTQEILQTTQNTETAANKENIENIDIIETAEKKHDVYPCILRFHVTGSDGSVLLDMLQNKLSDSVLGIEYEGFNFPLMLLDAEVMEELSLESNVIELDINLEWEVKDNALDEETQWLYGILSIEIWDQQKKISNFRIRSPQGVVMWKGREFAEEQVLEVLVERSVPKILQCLDHHSLKASDSFFMSFLLDEEKELFLVKQEIVRLESLGYFKVVQIPLSFPNKMRVEIKLNDPSMTKLEILWNDVFRSLGKKVQSYRIGNRVVFQLCLGL